MDHLKMNFLQQMVIFHYDFLCTGVKKTSENLPMTMEHPPKFQYEIYIDSNGCCFSIGMFVFEGVLFH